MPPDAGSSARSQWPNLTRGSHGPACAASQAGFTAHDFRSLLAHLGARSRVTYQVGPEGNAATFQQLHTLLERMDVEPGRFNVFARWGAPHVRDRKAAKRQSTSSGAPARARARP